MGVSELSSSNIPRLFDFIFKPFTTLFRKVKNHNQYKECDKFIADYKSGKIWIDSICSYCEFGVLVYSVYYKISECNKFNLYIAHFSHMTKDQINEFEKMKKDINQNGC